MLGVIANTKQRGGLLVATIDSYIHIQKIATHACIRKHIHISFRVNKIAKIQYDIFIKRVGFVILRILSSSHKIQP